jgi:tRNA(Ile)-lysidine synthase
LSSQARRRRTKQRQPATGGSGSSPNSEPVTPDADAAWAPFPGAPHFQTAERVPHVANRKLAARVGRFATEEKLFRRTKKVLAAVSGGPDSVALLLVLLELRRTFGFEVVACHFDHQLRAESAADLAFVRELCAGLGVECLTGEGDVAAAAREQRKGIEEIARQMRYQFLAFVAGKERADCIATGHTFDDQAETVLMHIVRGSGVRGVRGMLPQSPVPGAQAQRLIRPLLVLRREETMDICSEAGIEPLRDPSNADPAYTRNRLRNETLDALRVLNPSIEEALNRLAMSAREVFADVERQSHTVQPSERSPIGALLPLQGMRALGNEAAMLVIDREAGFYSLRTEVNRTRLQNLRTVLASGAGEVRFGEAIVEASAGKIRIGPALEPVEPFEPNILNVPGVTIAGSWRVTVATDPLSAVDGAVTGAIRSTGLRGALRFRQLEPGDRMLYRGLERKIPDIVNALKLPAWERPTMVAVADSNGVVALFGTMGAITEPPTDDALYIRIAPVA